MHKALPVISNADHGLWLEVKLGTKGLLLQGLLSTLKIFKLNKTFLCYETETDSLFQQFFDLYEKQKSADDFYLLDIYYICKP